MSQENKQQQPLSLSSFSYKLKNKKSRNGSLGSLWTAIKMCFDKIDPETAYGKKFNTIKEKVTPLMVGLNKLFVDYYCETGDQGSLIFSLFLEDFRGKCYVKGGNKDHFQAYVSTLVAVLLHHLRYWENRLDKRGWNGKYWDTMMEFHEELKTVLTCVPERREETVMVRKRKEDDEEEHEEEQEESEEEVDDSKLELVQVQRLVEPLVTEIDDIVREAYALQRQAPKQSKTHYQSQQQQTHQSKSEWRQVKNKKQSTAPVVLQQDNVKRAPVKKMAPGESDWAKGAPKMITDEVSEEKKE